MPLPPPPPGFQLDAPQPSPVGRPVIRRAPEQPRPQSKVVKDNYLVDPNTGTATPIVGMPVGTGGSGLSKGQEAVDKKFADDYVSYTAGGGFSDIKKQLDQLKNVSSRLKAENLTGPVIGAIPDAANAFFNPDAVAVRENVEEVVQRNLRTLLGAQFTQKEGDRLIARSYNPRLPETENRIRLARLRIQMTEAAKAKEQAIKYFEENGTLKGWKGRLWSISDFNPEGSPGKKSAPPRKPSASAPRVVDFNDLP